MVTWFDGSDAFADRFNNAGAFVAEDNGEGTFGVFPGERVGVCWDGVSGLVFGSRALSWRQTSMANPGIVDLDADFMGFWRGNLDVFNGEVFACFPRHSGLSVMPC
jgi:hypothetical protein